MSNIPPVTTNMPPAKGSKVDSRSRGVWLTHDDLDTVDAEVVDSVTPHSSEIAALRVAVASGKTVTFVEFGTALADAVKAKK
jgi:hypothetical protein